MEVGAKVVRKAAPDEKVGVMCLEDGRPSIVEYYELTEQMRAERNEKGEYAYNFGVILKGGLLYTVGGVIYALKLKVFNEKHAYFGSHEIFHLFIMAGSFCHFIFMYQYVI